MTVQGKGGSDARVSQGGEGHLRRLTSPEEKRADLLRALRERSRVSSRELAVWDLAHEEALVLCGHVNRLRGVLTWIATDPAASPEIAQAARDALDVPVSAEASG